LVKADQQSGDRTDNGQSSREVNAPESLLQTVFPGRCRFEGKGYVEQPDESEGYLQEE